jgi:cell division protein FtsL
MPFMQQAAYDYDSVQRKQAAQQQEKQKELRVVRGGRRKLTLRHAVMHHAMPIVAMALLVGLAVNLLQSEARITELTSQIQTAKATLVTEQSDYTYYTSTLNNKASIANVEEAASRLGLMKMDDSQITYIRLDNSSVLVRKESTVRQWTDFLHAGALTLMGITG